LSATKSAAEAKFTMILSGETPRATRYGLAEARRRQGLIGRAGRSVLVRPLT
jgi:hypothetical protein